MRNLALLLPLALSDFALTSPRKDLSRSIPPTEADVAAGAEHLAFEQETVDEVISRLDKLQHPLGSGERWTWRR
jgi:hypothetical protein